MISSKNIIDYHGAPTQIKNQKKKMLHKKLTTTIIMNKTEYKQTFDVPHKIHDHKNNVEIMTVKFQELQGMISTNQTSIKLLEILH